MIDDHVVQLKPEARRFLEKNGIQEVVEKCPHCVMPIKYKLKKSVSGEYDGLFEELLLHSYPLKDGRVAYEEIKENECTYEGESVFSTFLNVQTVSEAGDRLDSTAMFVWTEEEVVRVLR